MLIDTRWIGKPIYTIYHKNHSYLIWCITSDGTVPSTPSDVNHVVIKPLGDTDQYDDGTTLWWGGTYLVLLPDDQPDYPPRVKQLFRMIVKGIHTSKLYGVSDLITITPTRGLPV